MAATATETLAIAAAGAAAVSLVWVARAPRGTGRLRRAGALYLGAVAPVIVIAAEPLPAARGLALGSAGGAVVMAACAGWLAAVSAAMLRCMSREGRRLTTLERAGVSACAAIAIVDAYAVLWQLAMGLTTGHLRDWSSAAEGCGLAAMAILWPVVWAAWSWSLQRPAGPAARRPAPVRTRRWG
jgi:hypothetical protein